MKIFFRVLILITLSSCSIFKNNINGLYKLEVNKNAVNYGVLEVVISNNSTYATIEYSGSIEDVKNYKKWRKKITTGKIIKIIGNNYKLKNYSDSLDLDIKIRGDKMIVFGLNRKFKRVKVFEIKKYNQ